MGEFERAFASLTGNSPFPWQWAFYELLLARDIPSSSDIPAGLGKTSVIAVWLLARVAGAPVPTRLVYVVNRRTVVEETTDEVAKPHPEVVRYRHASRTRPNGSSRRSRSLYRHVLYTTASRLKTSAATATTAEVGVFAIERFAEAEYPRADSCTMHASFKLNCTELSAAPARCRWTTRDPRRVQRRQSGTCHLGHLLRFAAYRRHDAWLCARIDALPALRPVRSWVLEWGVLRSWMQPAMKADMQRHEIDVGSRGVHRHLRPIGYGYGAMLSGEA